MTAAKELKSLYYDYNHGLITRDVYRASRARILDAAALRQVQAAPTDTDATRPKSVAPEPPLTREARVPTSAPAAGSPSGGIPRVLLIAVPALAIAALVAWFLARAPEAPVVAGPPPPTAAAQGAAATPVPVDRAKALARKFLFANDWSDSSVGDFVASWQALTPEERAAAAKAVWMPGLVETIRRYVQEERSLLAAAGAAGDVSPSLAELSQVFGIDVASLPVEAAPPAVAAAPGVTALLAQEAPTAVGQVPPATTAVAAAPPVVAAAREPTRVAQVADSGSASTTQAPTATPVPSPAPGAAAPVPAASPLAAATPAPASVPAAAAAVATTMTAAAVANEPSAGALEAPGAADPCPSSLVGKHSRLCRDDLRSAGKGPLLVVVPKGRFRMGSDASAEEGPPHDVTIGRPIAIGVYEVSVDEYRLFCNAAGRACAETQGRPGDSPVVMVSWRDATAYAEWLSAQTGQRYRLPTEAEWEYAARAGTQARFPFGDEITSADVAFAGPRTRSSPAPRSERFNKNRFGLHHAVGNVREWVQDDWSPTYEGAPFDGSARGGGGSEKVVRGGSFADGIDGVRSSSRKALAAGSRDKYTGFRVARDVR